MAAQCLNLSCQTARPLNESHVIAEIFNGYIDPRDLLLTHLTLIPTTYEVWEWICNFIPHFIAHEITHPCWD